MKWFNQNGDKLLAGLAGAAAALGQTGVTSPWIAGILGISSVLHTVFWPDNPPAQTPR